MSLLLIGTLVWLSFAVLALSLGRAAKLGDLEELARARRAATLRKAPAKGTERSRTRQAAAGPPAPAALETRSADAA